MNDSPHGDWENLFEQLPLDTTAREEHQEALKSRMLDAFAAETPPPTDSTRLKQIGHILMTYKAPHWTAAAILIMGVVWFTQFSGAPAFAIDELVEHVMNARTARYDMTATIEGQPPQKMKAYYLAASHFRQELDNGYINVADWQVGKMVGLDPKAKRATVFNLVNRPEEMQNKMPPNQFEMVRELLRQAQDDPDTKVESLGEKQLEDGRTAIGFGLRVGIQPMTIWADPESRMPITIETSMVGPPKTEVVMTNYEFNVDLDEEMFSVTIPDGYKVVAADVDASWPTETDFITSLRMCGEVTDGQFPAGFDSVTIAKYVATYLAKKGIGTEEPNAEQFQEVLKIARGFQFALTRQAESDAHYAGATAQAGDATSPIFWYKPKGSQVYRVIYADFSVREIDEAPVVEGAVRLVP